MGIIIIGTTSNINGNLSHSDSGKSVKNPTFWYQFLKNFVLRVDQVKQQRSTRSRDCDKITKFLPD